MASELAFVLINPYTIAKSRTGGVIGRFMSRTGLDLVAARMFSPGKELIETYASMVDKDKSLTPAIRRLLADYVLCSYAPDSVTGRSRRVLMILLEGADAIQKVRDMAGPVTMGGGETIRDTFGDYVVDENKRVNYFEPAVLIGSSREETVAALKLWSRYATSDGGFLQTTVDNSPDAKGWQRTLVLIKPDNFRFPSAKPGNIIDLLSRSGLRIIAAKVHRMSVAQAEEFYRPVRQVLHEKMKRTVSERATKALEAELGIAIPDTVRHLLEEQLGPLFGDEQFNQIVKFMTGCYPPTCAPQDKTKDGPSKCLALVYGGVGAVEKIRNLLGATDPNKAQTGSVRREFGLDVMVNAAHASDSVENAEREIGIIKVDEDLITPWVRKYYGD
ncbi:MAG: nucleoside-diphosphate kinase [Kiritimatiellae bacterium]|nr:nucleoside-diphosphate kinase [Kiritimatiellia bacterium]